MIETLTIVTLSFLFLIFFRPGKTPPLSNPLVILRPGQYHMTLAPQLNLAQPFIEAVAKQIGENNSARSDSTTLCFEVQDKEVAAHGQELYLLAITQRNGMLYFQAACPSPLAGAPGSFRNMLMESVNGVLADVAAGGLEDTALNEHITLAVNSAAQQRGIQIRQLTD